MTRPDRDPAHFPGRARAWGPCLHAEQDRGRWNYRPRGARNAEPRREAPAPDPDDDPPPF